MDDEIKNEDSKKNAREDEISLIDLFAVIWRRKKMIFTIVGVAMAGILIFSIISLALPSNISPLPNEYTSKAYMLINEDSSSSSRIPSLGGNMGSLASMMGISASGKTTNNQLALFLMGSNTLLDAVTDEFDLIERFKIKKEPRANSRRELKKILKAVDDGDTKIFSINYTDIDPVFAQSVVNFCVKFLEKRFAELGVDKNAIEKENLEKNIQNAYEEILKLEKEARSLNQSVSGGYYGGNVPLIGTELNRLELELNAQKEIYTQLKIQHELIKVRIASETPVFQVLEYAEVPDQKSKPSRGMLCIIVAFAAGFLAVFLAFALDAIENIKRDTDAMAKLRVKKYE